MNVSSLMKDKSYSRSCHISTVSIHPKLKHALYNIILRFTPSDVTKDDMELTTSKRFSDFKKLYQVISVYHAKLHRPQAMPQLVKSSYFDKIEPPVLEERKASIEAILKFCCQHYHLYTHPLFVHFFEEDSELQNVSRLAGDLQNSNPLIASGASDLDILSHPNDETPVHYREGGEDPIFGDVEDLLHGSGPEVLQPRVSHCFEQPPTPPPMHQEILTYLQKADEHRRMGETFEIAEDYDGALQSYKDAVAELLRGVNEESDEQIRELVRQLTEDYLSRAEKICSGKTVASSSVSQNLFEDEMNDEMPGLSRVKKD